MALSAGNYRIYVNRRPVQQHSGVGRVIARNAVGDILAELGMHAGGRAAPSASWSRNNARVVRLAAVPMYLRRGFW